MVTMIISTLFLIMISVSLIAMMYTITPILTTTLLLTTGACVLLVGGHAWYTRRNFTQSLSLFLSPAIKTGSVLRRVSESLRRDTPPSDTNPSDSMTPAEKYAAGEITTVNELENELEEKLTTETGTGSSDTGSVDELDAILAAESD